MKRLENWESRLAQYLEGVGPFQWGSNDCCMFAAGAVHAMTGADLARGFRGYKSARGAKKRLDDAGGVRAIARLKLDAEVDSKLARRGDVVVFDSGNGDALGVCIGERFAAAGPEGVLMFPMTAALAAWRV